MRIAGVGSPLFLLLCLMGLTGYIGPMSAFGEANAAAKGFDGPAELPRIYLRSALVDTPAPGRVIQAKAGDNLQEALNNAACGDTVQLEAGAIFSGLFTLRSKPCDDAHWIIVRTSANDLELPPEGTRMNPCYGGVASLPSRPAFHCKAKSSVLSQLLFTGRGGSGPLSLDDGANHYRLIGLEITRSSPGGTIYNLVSQKSQKARSAINHIIFDRMWIHGTAQDETTRGILLGPSSYVSIVDSYFSDFHCIARVGTCIDSQAIAGGISDGPVGPYKIVNNFLEAAGEGILFGGSSAEATPADVEIRRNHFYKPIAWKVGEPGFLGSADGHPFIVKNLFELKNAQRVLLEGNLLDNCWGGFTQAGFGILLTPKNQRSGARNICPLCLVTDVTIRYNRMSHVAGGLQIANATEVSGGAQDGQRYSIHDLIIDDLDGVKFGGAGIFAQLSTDSQAPVLQNVSLDHITAFPNRMLFNIGGSRERRMTNITFTNSIVRAGQLPVWSTGGTRANCASADVPAVTFQDCFAVFRFTHNAIIDATGDWPKGNFFPGNPKSVDFVNFGNGNGGDYHLLPKSKYKNKGSDGKDLGADVDAILAATSGVE